MEATQDPEGSQYERSSFSGGGNCVEVDRSRSDGLIAVRHSRRPAEPPLLFNRTEWTAFVLGVKAGEFDAP